MPRPRLGLAGFGNVGREFARMLLERRPPVDVVFVADSRGALVDPSGIEPRRLEEALGAPRGGVSGLPGGRPGAAVEELLEELDVDILVDATPSVYEGEPRQLSWYRRVLSSGGAVVAACKAPLAVSCGTLLSGSWRGRVYYKATVMAGTPLIDLLRYGLRGRRVLRVRGVLNGTSVYVLGLVEKGMSLGEAVEEAARRGYAEPDPSTDLHGLDLAAKAAILSCTLGRPVSIREVEVVDRIEPGVEERARRARKEGMKLVYAADVPASGAPRVALTPVPPSDPLYRVEGVLNAAVVETEEAEPITVYGPGAGARATAASMLSDLSLALERLGV